MRGIKSRKIIRAGHVAHGEMESRTIFWLENMKGKDHLEDIGIDWRIILK
jgi:hypothetical protein